MSAIDPGSEPPESADHAYFQALESAFLRLRGAPLLLAPADWQVARKWRRLGIPLELILRTLEEVHARRAARPGRKRTISSLRYFAPAVEAAWEEVAELTAGGEGRAPAPPLEVGQRLAALAGELPASLPEREHLAARILALAGAPEVVEAELARLDDALLTAAENALKPDERRRLAEETSAAMEEWRRRLPPDAVAAAADRLRRQTVRRRLGLPVLSLFAAPPESD